MPHVQTLTETSTRLLKTFSERRRSGRIACGDTVQVMDAVTRSPIATATLANISQGGVGIRLPYALTPGKVVILRNGRLDTPATVRHSTRTDFDFIVGCEFERPLLALWL
jgi:hypothetical protein